MGLWGGSNNKMQGAPTSSDAELIAKERIKQVRSETAEFKRGDPRQNLRLAVEKREKARFESSPLGRQSKKFGEAKFALGKNVGQAALAGMQQQPTFSREQEMMGEMFGGGSKIWGTNQEPVRINNDLNSSRSDPWDETAGMFGAGPHGERSGLY